METQIDTEELKELADRNAPWIEMSPGVMCYMIRRFAREILDLRTSEEASARLHRAHHNKLDETEAEIERLKVELRGERERAMLVFAAKNCWANRARALEAAAEQMVSAIAGRPSESQLRAHPVLKQAEEFHRRAFNELRLALGNKATDK